MQLPQHVADVLRVAALWASSQIRGHARPLLLHAPVPDPILLGCTVQVHISTGRWGCRNLGICK